MEFDAAILGCGTAGSVAALNLAPLRRVVALDRYAIPPRTIGESLPGIARRLMRDMGLLQGFLRDGHIPRYALRGSWGDGEPAVRDSLADPDGHGWQLDRVRFELSLRAEAVRRGATLLSPARVGSVERVPSGWRLAVEQEGRTSTLTSRILIDARGRRSHCVADQDSRRYNHDRLCCVWVRSECADLPHGLLQIEAEAQGWWYVAPVPPGAGGILAFHTDSDIGAARAVRTTCALIDRAQQLPMVGSLIDPGQWVSSMPHYCAAHGTWLERAAGDNWLAVGDAALAFDPLAAQGLYNAMYLGLAAAEAVHRRLDGEEGAFPEYAAEVRKIRDGYLFHRAAWYSLERRWPDQAFWRRRHA